MVIALGKENLKKIKNTLCRVPVLWHSAKRLKKQISLPSAGAVALGKELKKIRRHRPSADGVKSLPSARNLALGKAAFTGRGFDGGSLPSVALGKGFAECKAAFAECNRHSTKSPPPVVHACNIKYRLKKLITQFATNLQDESFKPN